MNNKVVLILSGGLDSTTVLYTLLDEGKEVEALSFNYGQKGNEEINRAKRICEMNNVKHNTFDIREINKCLTFSSLVDKNNTDTSTPYQTVVPSRNTLLIELATAYAISNDCEEVYYGAINDDVGDYPDTTPEFLHQINELNKVNNYKYIPVKAPLINCSKEEVVKRAMKLGVPIELTFSCYQPLPDGSPCGECFSCKSRIEAIKKVENAQ